MKFAYILLSELKYFELGIGKRVLKKEVYQQEKGLPLFSANVKTLFGFISKSNLDKFEYVYILWGIDSYFEFNIMPKGAKFATTDHCGSLYIKNEDIIPEYVIYRLNQIKLEQSFDRSWRPSLKNMSKIYLKIPIIPTNHDLKTCTGYKFDVVEQIKVAKKYKLLQKAKNKLQFLEEEIKQLVSITDNIKLDDY